MTQAPSTTAFPQALSSLHLHNLFRVATNIYSGDFPDTDAAFRELASLGVTTVVSVDGKKPNLENAQKHGLRYVHLPFGYDHLPSNRVAELVQVARAASGPVYVHCHHGKHRGPAAAAIMGLGTAAWNTDQAVAFLRQAGTSTEYMGLYRSVSQFEAPQLPQHSKPQSLPEIAATSKLVDSMVSIDDWFDRLRGAQKNQWQSDPRHPELSPIHSALMVWEHFHELARSEVDKNPPAAYRESLDQAVSIAKTFHEVLRSPGSTAAGKDESFIKLSHSCSECHKVYRNKTRNR